jgi:hypothetical protein
MQIIAAALGKTSDTEKYAALTSDLLQSFQSEFATAGNGTYYYGSGSQASNSLAIDMGVVPSEHLTTVVQSIIDSIVDHGNHLSVGEIALPSLFRALGSQGQDDTIYKFMTELCLPGSEWRYGLDQTLGWTDCFMFGLQQPQSLHAWVCRPMAQRAQRPLSSGQLNSLADYQLLTHFDFQPDQCKQQLPDHSWFGVSKVDFAFHFIHL